MEKYNTLKNKKDYTIFLSKRNDYLKEMCDILRKENLIFDEKEIRQISGHFIDLKKNGLFDNNEKRKLITYFGEAFMQRYGGEWSFTGLKSDSFAINEPVITKYRNEGIRESPSEVIDKMFEENNDDYFNWSIKYTEEFQKKKDDIFTQLFPKKKKK